MKIAKSLTRWLGAYVVAAIAGYTLASIAITTHNLARLSALDVEIGATNVWQTILFDFKGLSPTFSTITKYGSVLWLGYFIAFATAPALHVFLSRFWRRENFDIALSALAGVTSMVVGIAIVDAQYKVSLISGTGGVSGYVTQLLAGAAAGAVFALCYRRSTVAEVRP